MQFYFFAIESISFVRQAIDTFNGYIIIMKFNITQIKSISEVATVAGVGVIKYVNALLTNVFYSSFLVDAFDAMFYTFKVILLVKVMRASTFFVV